MPWQMGGIRALDASVFLWVNHLPHTRETDAVVDGLSDLGKGAGWVVVAVLAGLTGEVTGGAGACRP